METLYDNITALIAGKGETSLEGNEIKVKFKMSAEEDYLGSRFRDTVTVDLTYKFNPDKPEYAIGRSTNHTSVEIDADTDIQHNNDGLLPTETLTGFSRSKQLYMQTVELEKLCQQIENCLSEAGWTLIRGFFSSLFW